MKNFVISLNDYLLNFWFVVALFMVGGLATVLTLPLPWLISFGQSGNLNWLPIIILHSFYIFFLPLAIISLIISIIIWTKGDLANSRRGLSSLLITLISLTLIFIFIAKLSYLSTSFAAGLLI